VEMEVWSVKGEPWRDILEARYVSWRKMEASLGQRNQSLWWKDLCRICSRGIQENWFDGRFQWTLGDERSVKFWDDRWADDQVLKEKFPRLFIISQCKDSMMGDIIDWEVITSGGSRIWNLGWRRERFEWKKHLEEQLLILISKVHWIEEGQDRLVWVGDDNYEYTVKSEYSV